MSISFLGQQAQLGMQANIANQNGIIDPNASNISAACAQLSNGLYQLSSQATPTMPPQQPMQQQQQQVSLVNGAMRPVQLSQQPVGQPSVPTNQSATGPPQCKCVV